MPMKGTIFKGILLILFLGVGETAVYSQQQQRKDTLVVTRDGTGDYRNIQEAVEAVRAFMDYTVTIYIKNGTYKEKLVIPSWVKNVQLVGESAENTIITYDDHANINKMGTFRTYTVKVSGNDITFKDLTIENNAAPLGQAVALHTEGDRLMFINCRFLGNQDTIYTGSEGARLLFTNCYIEGTTDFIFGPSTALFEYCELHSKRDSYITAASTPQNIEFGYVFKNCKLTAAPGVKKVYLGRPWRPYAATAFINCEFGNHIRPEGWHNWKNPENEKTARYAEFGNTGEGAKTEGRVAWAEQLTKKEVLKYTPENIFKEDSNWYHYVVAQDGSGDFFTVQEAINAVPDFRKNIRTTILIRKGTYKEKIIIPESKINVALIGEEGATLTNDDFANKKNVFGENMGTSGSSSCYIYAPDFYAENITFENSAGPVGQAVACFVSADRAFFKNCRFLGFQDTLYTYGKQSRQYYEDCYIEGTVDFIFGWSTAVFNRCHIHSKRDGYVTAPSTDQGKKYGYVFYDCKLTASPEAKKVYLSRPWRPYAQAVFVRCELGQHVLPEGWNNWGKKENEKTAFYAEYDSRGEGANPKARAAFSHQLKTLKGYEIETVLAGDDGWNPVKNGNHLLDVKR